jgi:hypothetical protein
MAGLDRNCNKLSNVAVKLHAGSATSVSLESHMTRRLCRNEHTWGCEEHSDIDEARVVVQAGKAAWRTKLFR